METVQTETLALLRSGYPRQGCCVRYLIGVTRDLHTCDEQEPGASTNPKTQQKP